MARPEGDRWAVKTGAAGRIDYSRLHGCLYKTKLYPLILVLLSFIITGCTGGVIHPKGPIGVADLTLLIDSLAIMLAIVVPTIITTIGFAWWFRASNPKAHHRPNWDFSGSIELVVWSIPLLTVLLVGGVTWVGAHALDPYKPIEGKGEPLEVQVVSLDWKWLFIYPELHVASVNELTVPVGRALHFTLTSSSVMNAFFVPELGSMIYTMNGMATQLWLRADESGNFLGLSSHFSGEGFADMRFVVKAVATDQFDAWVEKSRINPSRFDKATYTALAKQSIDNPVATYGDVETELFNQIVRGNLAPAPGPGTKDQNAHTAPVASTQGN